MEFNCNYCIVLGEGFTMNLNADTVKLTHVTSLSAVQYLQYMLTRVFRQLLQLMTLWTSEAWLSLHCSCVEM